MAEQTPPSNGDSSDFLRKRTHQDKQSGDAKLTAGQRSIPPKRGLLKRSKGNAASDRTPATGRVLRTPITKEQTGPQATSNASPSLTPPLPPSAPRPSHLSSQNESAQAKVRRPTSARDPGAVDPKAVKSQPTRSDRLEKREIEAEERRKFLAEKEQKQDEIKAAKLAERERKTQLRAQALQKAEEERVQKQKELELKKAEAARIRLEKEAEAKRLEKENELKRLEEEKIFQEKKGQRIYESIESFQGELSEKEQQLARTIAEEMVKRNIHWEGYISLHSGIGGSMLS
ncbi:MAG: hypothetical protein HN580_10865 [Deltaproteobacteria bacterium]|jgi:hypothetical protein|nr:hypothetical protein [Deltaproteobacteria bacterium]MBT4263597.1 hypothetical protein [Deltaproteobacteria bacterium]MBT4644324.1 hypothetical protein [Deltaproteobacteria bacterium]MBT6500405.1 hypothetical protein [Deltaproteobacteria bacterium]MBT6610710.1 hypothetical protein [Deltaproteobacteria bacterium]